MDIQKRKRVWELAIVSMLLTITAGYSMNVGLPKPAKAEMLAEGDFAVQMEADTGQESGREAGQGNAQTDPQELSEGTTDSEGTETAETEIPASHVISDFPIIYQTPELPTGCEITAAAMALNYYGFQVDKTVLAEHYLPTLYSAGIYYGQDGRTYGNDMNEYFIGDPRTENGIICGTGAIVTALDSCLSDIGSSMRAADLTGAAPEELYRLVSGDVPVVVWCTIGMTDRGSTQGWYTESGAYVDWASNDHGAVLIGYGPDTVTIADPISGLVEYSREQFESVFASRSYKCVIIQEEVV